MILNASAFALPLKDESVHCCVTSPPYWGLRKYSGLPPTVFGGEGGCEHEWFEHRRVGHGKLSPKSSEWQVTGHGAHGQEVSITNFCKCGAWLGDFGLEPTIELYIEHSMQVLDELWRVLRKDGTCWWNLGDSYAANWGSRRDEGGGGFKENNRERSKYPTDGLKPKDLCLVPYRFALAAQARGWWIRSAIIWAKPNPMPESCTDRPTDAYEHIFLMTKAKNYWYDAEAVREKAEYGFRNDTGDTFSRKGDLNHNPNRIPSTVSGINPETGRNLRNVWTFATQPYKESHFAVFPEELPRRCILAGCPEKVCAKCGAGWVRILEKIRPEGYNPNIIDEEYSQNSQSAAKGIGKAGTNRPLTKIFQDTLGSETKTLGWKPSCDCGTQETAKGVCLDPFAGSGTVVDVAIRSGREGIGIELSREYLKLATKRTAASRAQGVLL